MSHTFPALPYPYDALEPYIDAKTMEVHYSKHHKTYFDKFVTAVQGSELETQSLDEIFAAVSQHSPAIRNNGGGYYNHILYWNCMSPEGGGEPQGALAQALFCTQVAALGYILPLSLTNSISIPCLISLYTNQKSRRIPATSFDFVPTAVQTCI